MSALVDYSDGSIKDEEDGEIMDDESGPTTVIPEFVPLASRAARKIIDDCDDEEDERISEDDEAPEEILNKVARMKTENVIEDAVDPKLCKVCKENEHKYKCPKCNIRTCSLKCIKEHKEGDQCDGVRGPFSNVAKLSQYDDQKSIEDQKWMTDVVNKVYAPPPNVNLNPDVKPTPSLVHEIPQAGDGYSEQNHHNGHADHSSSGDHQLQGETSENSGPPQPFVYEQRINEDGTRNSAKSAVERFLLPNAAHRRIWLSFSDEKGEDCSRHEQFSDSIFWCIDFIFTQQLEDGTKSEYTYRVQNIPETIRLCTILKQFVSPRQYGCIVSKGDLDMDKMAVFIEAGLSNVNMFMKVPRYEKERYYVMNPDRNMLDNTRNRVIVDHPKVIVTLNNQCMDFQTLSESEGVEIRERMQKERGDQNRQSGGYRGGRGGFRGGEMRGGGGFRGGRGRGGFRGGGGGHFDGPSRGGWQPRGRGGFQPNMSGGKRPYNGGADAGDFKRGRGGQRGGRGRFNNRQSDDFDPFEPFEGPVHLPLEGWSTGNRNEGSGSEIAN